VQVTAPEIFTWGL